MRTKDRKMSESTNFDGFYVIFYEINVRVWSENNCFYAINNFF